jgi:AraC family transcriptional regulator
MATAVPLIPVSTGRALVSRVVGPFVITLMEHSGDVRLERHRHREAIVGLLLRGRYDERLENRTVEPARASLLIKPPETPHANRIGSEGTDTILIQIQPDRIPEEHSRVLGRAGIQLNERFHRLGLDMLDEIRYGSRTSGVGLEALVNELLWLAAEPGRPAGVGYTSRQVWVRRVRDLLHDDDAVTLSDLAAETGVDRAHLARTFRAVFGCTVGEYARALRMEKAAELLRRPDATVGRIAAELGFFDQAHFTRAFRAAYGLTPRAWRRTQ